MLCCLPAPHPPPLITPPPLMASLLCSCPPPLPPVTPLLFLGLGLLLCHCLSSHLPLLWLIVFLLSTGTSASAASTAITCPSLWWLIVVLLMQHYCRRTAIGEYHYGASLADLAEDTADRSAVAFLSTSIAVAIARLPPLGWRFVNETSDSYLQMIPPPSVPSACNTA